jgi:hypothetical protein
MNKIENSRKYQKLYVAPLSSHICHCTTNKIEAKIAPEKIYGLLLPHFEVVLSEINPIIGSERASKNLGIADNNPAIAGSIPKAVIKKNEKTPSAPGNKLFTKCPAPKAAF